MLARAAFALLALLASAPAVHAQSGEITVMAYAGIFQDKYTEAAVKPFMARFPGVKVNYFSSGNSAQMLGTLRTQRSSPQVDVAIIDVSVSNVGNKEGILATLDPAKVPSLKDLHPMAFVPEGFGPAAEAAAEEGWTRQARSGGNQDKIRNGEKFGNLSGATAKVLAALAAEGKG